MTPSLPKRKMELSDSEWHTLKALVNTMVPRLQATDAYRHEFEHTISQTRLDLQAKLRFMLKLLSLPGPSNALTLSPWLIANISPADREQVLVRWSRSSLMSLRIFASAILGLGLLSYYKHHPEIGQEAEVHPHLRELRLQEHIWTIPKVKIPRPLSNTSVSILSTDVAIVGSGCAAMVAAYRLVKAGFRVLLVEKGYHINALTSPSQDHTRDEESFEQGGTLVSDDGSVMILAGSTVGGGGAVNWSCSLRTPDSIRQEWSTRGGVPLYADHEYDEAMDAIEQIMQVTDHLPEPHSFTNQLILDSTRKLGYASRRTGQNTGLHPANTGFVEFGSRSGPDRGGIAEFLRYSVENGASVLQRAHVQSIRHKNGHASGLNVVVNGEKELVINCKRVVVAAGALQTPVLLKRSRFRNKHIGQGLKLHPVTLVYGEFPTLVNKRLDPIMTTVSTEVDNLDGLHHGPKIEAIHHRPHLLLNFLPWKSSEDWQRKADSLPNLCSLLVITRDHGRGSVWVDGNGELAVNYTTSEFDMNALKQGSLYGANLLYIGGASRIFVNSSQVRDFTSSKPVDQRTLWDPEYRAWLREVEAVPFTRYDTKVGSAHQMATCRMSDRGPKHAAVDARGHLYECSNVHVIDSSVFPSASGVNPMISCMSTAYVLTRYLIDELRKSQTKL